MVNNGHSPPYSPVNKGVRQIDPLSGYLFVLYFEVFTESIHLNNNIKGIHIGNIMLN